MKMMTSLMIGKIWLNTIQLDPIAEISPRDKRIFSTGCSGTEVADRKASRVTADLKVEENATLNDCFRDKKDWRACKNEVSRAPRV